MRRFWRLVPAAGLCAGLGLTMAIAGGQPPEKKGPPPAERGDRKGPPPPAGDHDRRPEPKPDPQVDSWLRTLTERMTDPHDTIRDSARAGIIAAGRAALPTLRKLADGDDAAKATAARRLIAAVEHGRPPHGPGMHPPPPFAGPGDDGPGGRPPFPPPPGARPGGPGGPRGEPGDRPGPRGGRPDRRPPGPPGGRPGEEGGGLGETGDAGRPLP